MNPYFEKRWTQETTNSLPVQSIIDLGRDLWYSESRNQRFLDDQTSLILNLSSKTIIIDKVYASIY